MLKFEIISKILPEDKITWNRKVFVTFDIDWAHDEIIDDTLDLLKRANIPATFFVTHNTNMLRKIRLNPNFELAAHPNFNFLIDGKFKNKTIDASDSIVDILNIVPGAKSVRSHSLTQSEKIIDIFIEKGFSHISNFFIPHGAGIDIKPFRLWNNSIIVPHCWQDNVALKMLLKFPSYDELKCGFHVFDFHPIHVFLNTEDLSRYERTRSLHQKPDELLKHRYQGKGTRTRLLNLLNLIEKKSNFSKDTKV